MIGRAASGAACASRSFARSLALGLGLALVLALAGGCTGVGIREFAHESYQPAAEPLEVARVFDAAPGELWSAFVAVLRARRARFEVREDQKTRAVARVPWSRPEEAAASVDLGRIRYVATKTTRTYRSWSPLDFRCNACVVRNGRVVDQQTELLEDRVVVLDPASYRIEARVIARVEVARSGARLVLSLDLEAEPWEPPGLRPVSTGHLERELLEAVSISLGLAEPGSPAELR